MSPQPDQPITVTSVLQQQNHYQRLGFKCTSVEELAVESAYFSRLQLLQRCDTTPEDRATAAKLLDESFRTLSHDQSRAKYDRWLSRRASVAQTVRSELFLSRYQIGQTMLAGDRATICSARDTRLNRDVVIKRISPELLADPAHRAALRSEAELFASFNSSHLVKVLDYDIDSGAIVMERMANSLQSLAKPNGLPVERIQSMVEQALQGLNALHQNGIAHGRIDPSHLLIDDCNCVKLSLTPGLKGESAALHPGSQARHLAPEMLNAVVFGEPKLAIDIYALGFVALEAIVGKNFAKRVNQGVAFKGGDLQSWLLWHSSSTEYLPNIQELVPGIRPAFAAILDKMTCKHQGERYANAAECLAAIAEAQAIGPGPTASVTIESVKEIREIDLLGTPPQLEATYQSPSKLTWKETLSNPKLLLTPAGRNHFVMLGTGVLAAMVLLIASVGNSPSNAEEAGQVAAADNRMPAMESVDSANAFSSEWELAETELENMEVDDEVLAAASPEDTLDDVVPSNVGDGDWEVRFTIHQGGFVIDVDGKQNHSAPAWKLGSGMHQVRFHSQASRGEHLVEIELPKGHGGLVCSLQAPPKPARERTTESRDSLLDPDQDIRGATFRPSQATIPIVGAPSFSKAEQQAEILRSTFEQLARMPIGALKSKPAFELPQTPVDPRFAFALALYAHQSGDNERAKSYCQRALSDGKQFKVAFMPALQLLTRIHIEMTEYPVALTECRAMLNWMILQKSSQSDGRFADDIDELAWWTGTLIGFVEEATDQEAQEKTDSSFTAAHLQKYCSLEQWKKFRIGRTAVRELAAKIGQELDSFLAERTEVQEQNRMTRLLRVEAQKREEEAKSFNNWTYPGRPRPNSSTAMYYSQENSAAIKPNESLLSVPKVTHELPRYRGAHPKCFRTYAPCDLSLLAERAMDSIALPQDSRFASTVSSD